jgi:uncharacterized repeat protein (TIGR01451 family)
MVDTYQKHLSNMHFLVVGMVLVAMLTSLFFISFSAQTVSAASLVVTSNLDTDADGSVGPSLPFDEADGAGLSLREAIAWANDADTITFSNPMTIYKSSFYGAFTLTKNIIINGDVNGDGTPDVTLNGDGYGTVLKTEHRSADCVLEYLHFSDGYGDRGGGMSNLDSFLKVIGCIFSDNFAYSGGGGIYNEASSPVVVNCTFFDNYSAIGGGMMNFSSSPTVTNCTFSRNSYLNGGAGIYNYHNSSAIITNCIFWGSNSEIASVSSTPTVTCCDIQFGYPGTGNIEQDPLFVNPGAGNFHLQSGSPCVDKGSNTAPSIQTTDFENDARIIDGDGNSSAIVDMGADELLYEPVFSTISFTKTVDKNQPSPGDNLRYTITATNTGEAAAGGVYFSDSIDSNVKLLDYSVTTSQGAVIQGTMLYDDTVLVNLGSIPVSGSATITFEVQIDDPTTARQISNQAFIQGTNLSDIYSDDPTTITPGDPTVVDMKSPSPNKIGGEVAPVEKMKILLPLIGLAMVLGLAFYLGMRAVKRYRIH